MCGIAGIISTGNFKSDKEPLIRAMQASLRHRGPDDEGIYISNDRACAFAHTRLSIIDLSPAGHQPMVSADGRFSIVLNGEIYNFRELRGELESRGERFASNSDTEVVLRLYQRQGASCLEPLRGMFALAIWDDHKKTCFLARDPLGIKPLYYYRAGNTLVFASELRVILATGLPKIALSPKGLYGYLTTGTVPEPETMIDGIYCLEAGHWLHWSEGAVLKNRYWQIDFVPEKISPQDAVGRTRQALIDSISHHFVSDVPVSIFLSGGIDSTALVALARQTQRGELRTYSIAFDEPEFDESGIAGKTATLFETRHKEFKLTSAIARELFPTFLKTLDQPTIDGFNTYCISRIAANDGAKVVLSGLGGDELFGGYKSFQIVPDVVRWGRALSPVKPLLSAIGGSLSAASGSGKMRRLGDLLRGPLNTETAYGSLRGIFSHGEARAIMKQYLPEEACGLTHTAGIPSFVSLEDDVCFLELTRYMRNQLLRDSDVMSMAWGLEMRVPLVDRALFETISTIPSAIRLAAHKRLLINSVPELPGDVTDRPKRGFLFPLQKWMEKDWDGYTSGIKCPKNIPLDSWYRKWSLIVLQEWLQNRGQRPI